MASFTDAEGRTWSLDLDLTTADEVKREKGIDLIDPEAMSATFVKLASGSTRLLVEVLWMLVHPQADKAGVSPEEFGRALKAQAIRDAYAALKDAIADFFLNPDAGAAMRRTWQAAEKVAAARLEEFTEAKIESLLLAKLSESTAGKPPESPASTHSPAA
jgi:hypothetical protein